MIFLSSGIHTVRSHRTFGYSRTPNAKHNSELSTVMAYRVSLVGRTFSSWTVFADAPSRLLASGYLAYFSSARCECGKERVVGNYALLGGRSKSCGCKQPWKTKHGYSKTRIYKVWKDMNRRCREADSKRGKYWCGRGITVCDRWRNAFSAFLEDMGLGKKGWTIERIDNDQGYSLRNCCWATKKRQARNFRGNRIVTVRGVTGCIVELCERFGVSYDRTQNRLTHLGWEPEQAFFAPRYYHVSK